jgi:hypothetical protein
MAMLTNFQADGHVLRIDCGYASRDVLARMELPPDMGCRARF